MVELGAGDRIVACTEFCEPGRDVPRVPWMGQGAAEAVLRTGAELVIKQRPRRTDDPLRRMLEKAGVTVVSIPSETIEDSRAAIVRLGEVLDLKREAAAYLKRFDDELGRARAGSEGKPRPRVLLVYARTPGSVANISAAGPGSFLDELIRYAGGENVLADVGGAYVDLRVEAVIRRAPEVVVDCSPGASRTDWSVLKTLPAVRAGRVYAMYDPVLLVPGPRLPQAVRRMVEMIHGRP